MCLKSVSMKVSVEVKCAVLRDLLFKSLYSFGVNFLSFLSTYFMPFVTYY